ncbi:MAG: diguanylate cyclase [Pyrinomonadaceae bacterium MAG19_C2-C3]|nr:diguanylate cyclase [Pyrinomonadaceae bacterium MAG19_C2-C3]
MNTSLTTVRARVASFIAPEMVGELIEQRDAAARLANLDALTGLANSRALDLALTSAEADADVHIIVFDLNNMGLVNKRCGHERGDLLITMAAHHIKRAAKAHGYGERVFRRGGDEFVVLCPARVAEGIRCGAERKFGTITCADVRVSLTGSIGATFDDADSRLQLRKHNQKARA